MDFWHFTVANVRHDSADECNYLKVERYFRGQDRGNKIKYTIATCGESDKQLDSSKVRTVLANDVSFDQNGLSMNGDVIIVDTPFEHLNCPPVSSGIQGDGEDIEDSEAANPEKRSSPAEEDAAEEATPAKKDTRALPAMDIQGDAGNLVGDQRMRNLN